MSHLNILARDPLISLNALLGISQMALASISRQSGRMEDFFGCDRRCESDPLIFRGKNNLYPRETFAAEIEG